jgi:hypothetical protein
MDRYYLCPIVGTGSEGNPFRAKVEVGTNVTRVSAAIKSDDDGKPVHRWTVCRVTATDFTEVEKVEGVTRLGERAALSDRLSADEKERLKNSLQDVDEDLDAKDLTSRALVTRLIKKHYPHVRDVLEAFP